MKTKIVKLLTLVMAIFCITSLFACEEKITVTFSTNGGTFEDGKTEINVEVGKNSVIEEYEEPTRYGYSFAGFSKDEAGDPLWNFETEKFTTNITLYAVWSKNSTIVTPEEDETPDNPDNGEAVPPHQHSFTNYVSDNNATCTADGTKTAKCDGCNETNTIADVGSKLPHSYTNYVSNNDATCTADGTKTAKCDGCDATDTIADVGSKLPHSYTNYVSDNNASCTADGTKTAKCDRCEARDTVTDEGTKIPYSLNLEFTENSDGTGYVVDGIGSETASNIYIPPTFNGKPVVEIADQAFMFSEQIINIEIPNSVTRIGARAFLQCKSLVNVKIGNDETATEKQAFKNSKATKIVGGYEPIGTPGIRGAAFAGCTELKSVTIGNNITDIYNSAFSDCTKLTNITIPDSVIGIGEYAFKNCTELAIINYSGTKAEWAAIKKAENWIIETEEYIVICTDGTISENGG